MYIFQFDPRKIVAALLALSILISFSAFSQQDVIAHKMNTRTEVTKPFSNSVGVGSFTAVRLNGMNEIKWTAFSEQNTSRYIVEYSTDGVNYSSAGEILPSSGIYELKHHLFESRPTIYRIKSQGYDGKYVYSNSIMLEGDAVSPVKVYPTMITGYTVNAIAGLPVERIAILNAAGQQVFIQSVNGKDNYLSIPLPNTLSKGMYWINFTGNGWQSTEKFIIP